MIYNNYYTNTYLRLAEYEIYNPANKLIRSFFDPDLIFKGFICVCEKLYNLELLILITYVCMLIHHNHLKMQLNTRLLKLFPTVFYIYFPTILHIYIVI